MCSFVQLRIFILQKQCVACWPREESQTVSINSGVEIVYSINLVLDLPCVCVLEERNLTSLVRLGLNFQRPYKRIIIHDVSTSLV